MTDLIQEEVDVVTIFWYLVPITMQVTAETRYGRDGRRHIYEANPCSASSMGVSAQDKCTRRRHARQVVTESVVE